MAFQQAPASFLLLALLVFSVQLTAGHAAVIRRNGDVAVYWGRNRGEGTLRETCDTGKYTTVIISFLAAFGHGTYRLDLSGHPVADVGADIMHCKGQGVLVLLAIGGQGGEYSLPTPQAAADLAEYIWNAFLAGSRPGVPRPFGDAQVDGIDFFIDQGGRENYNELARRLHAYNKYYRAWGVTLTATPRCAYPDHRLDEALATGLFDRIHVRLYGEDSTCAQTPCESWAKWAAAYPNSRVFVGVVASTKTEPPTVGYMPPEDLKRFLVSCFEKWPNYGGVMIWNRYYDKITGFTDRLFN